MYQLLAYFTLNILGFFVFYFIWLKLEKPEPYDYTTIPGLKCEELQLNKSSIVLTPATPINKISKSKGNLDEIHELGNANDFLQWLHHVYGPLAAFHWGSRYTVSVGILELVNSLKKYKDSLVPLNPFLYASILFGNSSAWQKSTKLNDDNEFSQQIASEQADLFVSYDPNSTKKDEELIECPCKWTKGPLCVVFECEMEIDAHPIPANIPILISVPSLLDTQPQSENIHKEFKWIFDKCFSE